MMPYICTVIKTKNMSTYKSIKELLRSNGATIKCVHLLVSKDVNFRKTNNKFISHESGIDYNSMVCKIGISHIDALNEIRNCFKSIREPNEYRAPFAHMLIWTNNNGVLRIRKGWDDYNDEPCFDIEIFPEFCIPKRCM